MINKWQNINIKLYQQNSNTNRLYEIVIQIFFYKYKNI